MKEIKKGDIVSYGNNKAKVIGISMKGGMTMYKIRIKDGFNTIAYNISRNEITK